MKLKFLLLALALAAVGLAQAGDMPWAKSFEAAKAKASKTKQLVMLDFYTDW
jgi:hypothetical protein